MAVTVLAVSSLASGLLIIGAQPIVNLSGVLLAPGEATRYVVAAWASVLPPTFGFTALAILASVVTRSSVAGIALPVAAAMAMQLYALVDGPEMPRRVLLTSSFGAWHGLFVDPHYYAPVVTGTAVSAIYLVVCAAIAHRVLHERDVGR